MGSGARVRDTIYAKSPPRLYGSVCLLLAIIRAQPTYEQVRSLCTGAMGLRGYHIGGTRAVGEVRNGFWYGRGDSTRRRWGVRLEEVTIYPAGD